MRNTLEQCHGQTLHNMLPHTAAQSRAAGCDTHEWQGVIGGSAAGCRDNRRMAQNTELSARGLWCECVSVPRATRGALGKCTRNAPRRLHCRSRTIAWAEYDMCTHDSELWTQGKRLDAAACCGCAAALKRRPLQTRTKCARSWTRERLKNF